MEFRTSVRTLALAAGLIALAGCGTSPTKPSNMQSIDQTGVTTTLGAVPSFTTDGLYDGTTITPLLRAQRAAGRPGSLAAITSVNYWRTFSSENVTYTTTFSDSDLAGRPRLAHVMVLRHLMGSFHILPGTLADPTVGDTMNIIQKPIDEWWVRHLLFHRLPADSAGSFEWHLAAATGVRVAPVGVSTNLMSIRITSTSGVDTTLNDMGGMWTLPRILRFAPDDSVTVIATTSRNDDVVVVHLPDHRFRMTNNGDNTYTFGWHTGSTPGWRHFGVNAFSHGTLYDDTLPYDSVTWIVPFAVTTDPTVVYLP
jgi:hypothetical protein